MKSIDADHRFSFETAAILASASPLGIGAMGAFPSSLVGFGQTRRWDFDARQHDQRVPAS